MVNPSLYPDAINESAVGVFHFYDKNLQWTGINIYEQKFFTNIERKDRRV